MYSEGVSNPKDLAPIVPPRCKDFCYGLFHHMRALQVLPAQRPINPGTSGCLSPMHRVGSEPGRSPLDLQAHSLIPEPSSVGTNLLLGQVMFPQIISQITCEPSESSQHCDWCIISFYPYIYHTGKVIPSHVHGSLEDRNLRFLPLLQPLKPWADSLMSPPRISYTAFLLGRGHLKALWGHHSLTGWQGDRHNPSPRVQKKKTNPLY